MDTFNYISALRREGAIRPREKAVHVAEQYVAAFVPSQAGTRVLMFYKFDMVFTQVMETEDAAHTFARRFPTDWKKSRA